jgi:hypothetical protein
MWARAHVVKIFIVLVLGVIVAFVLHRMYHPAAAKVCDHVAELAPNSVVQPKLDRIFGGAGCEAYFTALRDDAGNDDYSERSGCVLDAKRLSSVAACLEK